MIRIGRTYEFDLDQKKAENSLLYICNQLGGVWDMYSLLKILYFAEIKHLLNYGRPITGDAIIAMKHGPVPSWSYDKVKPEKIDKINFDIDDNIITAKQAPQLQYLSESEIECLNESINENKDLNFSQLKAKSHNKAYEETVKIKGLNSVISYLEIAKSFGANDELLSYLYSKIEDTVLC